MSRYSVQNWDLFALIVAVNVLGSVGTEEAAEAVSNDIIYELHKSEANSQTSLNITAKASTAVIDAEKNQAIAAAADVDVLRACKNFID